MDIGPMSVSVILVTTDHVLILMWEGTHAENSFDMVQKDRQTKGENQWNSKLTKQQITEIRAKYTAGGVSQRALGKEYRISQPHVCDIINKRRWGWM